MKVMEYGENREQGIAGQFKLQGQVFTCRTLPSGNLAYLIAAVNNNKGDGDGKLVGAVFDFMEKALIPDDLQRFKDVLLDPVKGLESDEIMEVFQEVVQLVAGGKAGGSSTASSSSPKRSGRASTATTKSTS